MPITIPQMPKDEEPQGPTPPIFAAAVAAAAETTAELPLAQPEEPTETSENPPEIEKAE